VRAAGAPAKARLERDGVAERARARRRAAPRRAGRRAARRRRASGSLAPEL
jgi:hypothetical protein